jgi:hypothetical protein
MARVAEAADSCKEICFARVAVKSLSLGQYTRLPYIAFFGVANILGNIGAFAYCGKSRNPHDIAMDWKRQCAAVIPCLNESGRIGPVVEAVRAFVSNVIVVDDGSSDTTAAEARAAGAEVMRHERNRGKGLALRDGWRRAHERGFEWVLSLDGDGQHAARDMPKFFARAEETVAPLIIGNRMENRASIPVVRRWVNTWMSGCLSKMAHQKLPDSQCGFRLAHLETLLSLPLSANGFVIESETLVAFLKAGKQVEFVPIQVIYGQRKSEICPFVDTWRWLRWWSSQLPVTS